MSRLVVPPAGSSEPFSIDRMAPTGRPNRPYVMRQRWAHLLFLHWPIPPELLRPLIPPGLQLDLFQGRAYVGLVPFTMTGVRPVCLPAVRGLSDFHEVNVRTYVHREGRDPGVWFFSLDAANRIAVKLARRFWHLPYHFARMSLECDPDGQIVYHSERAEPEGAMASVNVRYTPHGQAAASAPGTLQHFLIERYILYSEAGGRLSSGRVHHEAYEVQPARLESLDESLLAVNGIRRPDEPPLVHYSNEVRVRVYRLQRVT